MESLRNAMITTRKRLKTIAAIIVIIAIILLIIYVATRKNNRTGETSYGYPAHKVPTTESTTATACPKECYVPLPIPIPK